jgi:hypothetical protein
MRSNEKLIIECSGGGMYVYHESNRHHKVAELERKRQKLKRLDWDDIAQECSVQDGQYMVIPIVSESGVKQ